MLSPRQFPGVFAQLIRVVPPEYFAGTDRADTAYTFTFSQCTRKGKLQKWRLGSASDKKVDTVKDWYATRQLWFMQNPEMPHMPVRFCAYVEFIDDYREEVYLADDQPLFSLMVDLDGPSHQLCISAAPRGVTACLFA